MKSKQAKACDISKAVKDAVWERDDHKCIICGSYMAMPNAHYIPRSHGGLGIEENIVTLCADCHHAYDQTTAREWFQEQIKVYLESLYPNWNKSKLIYRRNNYEP